MDVNKVDAVLETVDRTVGTILPLVGTVGSLARLLIGMAKKQGLDTTTFEAEIAKFDTEHAALHAAVTDFRAKYGFAAGEGGTANPNPAGPAPGESTTIGS